VSQEVSAGRHGQAHVGTISGTSLTFGSAQEFWADEVVDNRVAFNPSSASAGQFLISFNNNGIARSILGQMAATAQATNLTSTNLIGIAAAAASSGATAKINTWGGINEAQSSLTIASDYYVQTDGTITTATGGQKVGQAISATTINMRNQP